MTAIFAHLGDQQDQERSGEFRVVMRSRVSTPGIKGV